MNIQSLINEINSKRQLLEDVTGELQLIPGLDSKTGKALDSIIRSLNNKLAQHDSTKHIENAIRLQNNERT